MFIVIFREEENALDQIDVDDDLLAKKRDLICGKKLIREKRISPLATDR